MNTIIRDYLHNLISVQSTCSRSVQLLETELLLSLVLDYGTVCHNIIACDTLSRFRHGLESFLFRQSYPSI